MKVWEDVIAIDAEIVVRNWLHLQPRAKVFEMLRLAKALETTIKVLQECMEL
jgi:hypothetical protein